MRALHLRGKREDTSGDDRVRSGVSISVKPIASMLLRKERMKEERYFTSFKYSGWRRAKWRYLYRTSSFGSFPWYYHSVREENILETGEKKKDSGGSTWFP